MSEWLTVLKALTVNDVVGGIFVIMMWACAVGFAASYTPRRKR